MREVPLADAVIAATPPRNGRAGHVRVFKYLDPRSNAYDLVWGACESQWQHWPDHRMGMLYEIIWALVLTFEFPPRVIHQALQLIPEYRDLDGNRLPLPQAAPRT